MKLPFGVAQGAVFYPYRISAALNDRDFFCTPRLYKLLIFCRDVAESTQRMLVRNMENY